MPFVTSYIALFPVNYLTPSHFLGYIPNIYIYIDIIYKIIVKHFLLFTNKFGSIDRYHIGYKQKEIFIQRSYG